MAYNNIMQFVIDKTSKELLRFGNCDFANDGQFNSGTEEIIEKDFNFDETFSPEVTYYYNSSTQEFQTDPIG
jgi:hypothetical protein